MNELSWLIYAADVSSKVGMASGFLAVGGGLVMVWLCFMAFAYSDDCNLPEEDLVVRKRAGRSFRIALPFWLVIAIIAAATPSKETLYAIAASEMGERVVQSETAGKAVQALNAWLDRQIAPVSQ